MHNEFTAIIERDGDWFIAYCPEIPRHAEIPERLAKKICKALSASEQ